MYRFRSHHPLRFFSKSLLQLTLVLLSTVIATPLVRAESSHFVAPQERFALKSFVSFGVNGYPADVALGHFTSSGFLDLVALNGGEPTINQAGLIAVFPGNGDGTFRPALMTRSLATPLSVAVGDVNRDGKDDIVVYARRFVAVFLSNGNGTFRGPAQYPVAGDNRDHFGKVGLADMNGDGAPDVILATAGADEASGTVQTLLNDGDGGFAAPVAIRRTLQCFGLASGDFDHDGKIDLAVGEYGNFSSVFEVFLGNGDGTVRSSQTIVPPGGVTTVSVGDVNNDGYLDAVLDWDNPLIALNKGDGTFGTPVEYTLPAPEVRSTLADVDRDGNLDVAAVAGYDKLREKFFVGTGLGNGRFKPALTFGGVLVWDYTYGEAITTGFINCDGDPALCGTHGPDIVVAFKGANYPDAAGLAIHLNQ